MEIKKLNTPKPGENYSFAQMGSPDLKIAEWRLRKAKQIEMKKGKDFQDLSSFISFQGASDLYTKRAITYQKNYIEVMERYQNYDNYDILMKLLKSIKNPNKFYEVLGNTEEGELDKDLTLQSSETLYQSEFNLLIMRIANSMGVTIDLDDVQEEGES